MNIFHENYINFKVYKKYIAKLFPDEILGHKKSMKISSKVSKWENKG